ncbi:MAG: carboxypeptidase-like regulatory domain-containing protein, partial [Acidobacteria bacterium]|nr:carboxypeptidase-like regulatory domain-containing protein [Acidobacteriota bacterium]
MKTKAHVCVLLLLLALFALPAVGQNISSSVKGTLVDPAGGVVPNAKCTLSNEATGAALSATSAGDGSFVFPNVLAGAYMLRVEATGFQALETKNIVVTASET